MNSHWVSTSFTQGQAFQSRVSRIVCRDPVVLEACDAGDWLGCMVGIEAGTVEFRIPNDSWQYRPINSAEGLNLAGFRSRSCFINQQVFPKSVVRRQLQELMDIYNHVHMFRFHSRRSPACMNENMCRLM